MRPWSACPPRGIQGQGHSVVSATPAPARPQARMSSPPCLPPSTCGKSWNRVPRLQMLLLRLGWWIAVPRPRKGGGDSEGSGWGLTLQAGPCGRGQWAASGRRD